MRTQSSTLLHAAITIFLLLCFPVTMPLNIVAVASIIVTCMEVEVSINVCETNNGSST